MGCAYCFCVHGIGNESKRVHGDFYGRDEDEKLFFGVLVEFFGFL